MDRIDIEGYLSEAIALYTRDGLSHKEHLFRPEPNSARDCNDHPYAIVLADSRLLVAPESVLALRNGDLFVIQCLLDKLGNLGVSSIEWGVTQYKCRALIFLVPDTIRDLDAYTLVSDAMQTARESSEVIQDWLAQDDVRVFAYALAQGSERLVKQIPLAH